MSVHLLFHCNKCHTIHDQF